MVLRPARLTVLVLAGLAACTGQQGCGSCPGFTATPQGTFAGTQLDSAGAARVSGSGYATLNMLTPQLLAMLAPDGGLDVPVDCSIQNVSILGVGSLGITVGDQGAPGCASETCGQLDGKCDLQDMPGLVHIDLTSLQLAPAAPDVVKAIVHAKVQTGKLMLASTSNKSALCLFSSRLKCSIDFDTARAVPIDNELDVGIELAIDTRWNKLLTLKVASLDGTKTCGGSGALPAPKCMDPNDIVIAAEGACGACTGANFSFVKQLMLDQLGSSLKKQLDDALKSSGCLKCGATGACPSSASATSACDGDAGTGTCIDPGTGLCVPAMLGTEGVVDVGAQLAAAGAPAESQLALSLAAGGGSSSDGTGTTVGLRGGFQAVTVPLCVAPLTRAAPLALALPDLDGDAPGAYDLAFSLSEQYLDEAFFQLQQSGALCLAVGHDTVAQLDSSALATLLPSIGKLTGGQSVPLRVVVRPMNPPEAQVGAGTVDSAGKPLDPLLRFNWKGVQIDVYALLDDRYARLFTLGADLSLPLGVTLDGCSTLTPTLGSLSQAVSNVTVVNSEILAEKLDVLKTLVPTLLATAEGSLAQGLPAITVPPVQGFQVKLTGAKGVGNIAGTSRYNHLGVYAQLLPPTPACVPVSPKPSPPVHFKASRPGEVEFEAPAGMKVQVRVDGGFWSFAQVVESSGRLVVEHPLFRLAATHVVEVRGEGTAPVRVVVDLR